VTSVTTRGQPPLAANMTPSTRGPCRTPNTLKDDMTEQASTPTAARFTKPLLATHTRTAADMAWADIATSVDEAMALWRKHRHTHVLASFGALPCGSTGLQLARRIRAEDSATRVFLLSNEVTPMQAKWARFSGAFAVVPRDRGSVAACLSGWTHHPRAAQLHDASPLDETMSQARQIIISSLLSLGSLSPEALSSIETTLARVRASSGRATLGVSGMARVVAERMQHGKDRTALLSWLEQTDAAKPSAPKPYAHPAISHGPVTASVHRWAAAQRAA